MAHRAEEEVAHTMAHRLGQHLVRCAKATTHTRLRSHPHPGPLLLEDGQKEEAPKEGLAGQLERPIPAVISVRVREW